MIGRNADITSHRARMPERDSGFLKTFAPTVAPAKLRGTRFVSLALHILTKLEAPQERFSEENFEQHFIRNAFLNRSTASSLPYGRKARSTQQAWMNSRNQTTIASAQTSSTVFLHPNQRTLGNRHVGSESQPTRLDPHALADSAPASTLQVFQFIHTRSAIQYAEREMSQCLRRGVHG